MPDIESNTIIYFIKGNDLWPAKVAGGPDSHGRYKVKTYGSRPLTFLVPQQKIWMDYDSAFRFFRMHHNAEEWDADKLIEQMQYLRSLTF